ncbi:anhydro-N-acetylmuramic acid kinase [Scopulibacillus darangshiensis]|uniref:Anhydro-N-acetylmuramic acid kinase n=1 Tax=Scopulibacillus darangshiensis TaxID=442528 RepID=A0A4V2SMW3_9BACL|nr:anhydro-N-acetylmuramic acid kinase AnmK [Scopulibacillus darangshiensis]TCP28856.1 anhydro-N-acetylmuramic acid kinase [Scopulibacillus darangshiensis]
MTDKYVVGLMSGTSLDGVDAALVKISGYAEETQVELIKYHQEDMPPELKKEIMAAIDPDTSDIEHICSLNFKLGYWFAEAVKSVCRKASFPLEDLDLIGSHGQTLYHIPAKGKDIVKSTLQCGEPAIITYETNKTIVSNFRSMDIAAGGEGAPLVPYVDYLLYRSDNTRALQNIGGIGNVTVIPAMASVDDVFGSDTGPGNMIIDDVCLRLFNEPYDTDGRYASLGSVNQEMLKALLEHPFIKAAPPKTTGREMFGKAFVDSIMAKWSGSVSHYDLMATVTQFTASSIINYYRKYILQKHPIDEVIISGGGSYNQTLAGMIKSGLPMCRVLTQEDLGFSSSAKEAIAFAVLANETINGQAGNIPNATGAKERVILGQITNPPKWNGNKE